MMERMNNADFHKFLTEFSDAVVCHDELQG